MNVKSDKKGFTAKEAVIIVLIISIITAVVMIAVNGFAKKATATEMESKFQYMKRALHAAVVEVRPKAAMEIDAPDLSQDESKGQTYEESRLISLIQEYLDPDIKDKYTIHIVVGKDGYTDINYILDNSTFKYYPKGIGASPCFEKTRNGIAKIK